MEELKKILKNKVWIILFIVFFVRIIIYSSYNDYTLYTDTSSYTNYNANILKGEVDEFRTPVYPYIIKLISLISETQTQMYKNITLFQELISIISVAVLYLTLTKEFKNQKLNYFATLLYACLPSIFTYNKVILTESLSISFGVMYFCALLRYIKKPTNAKTILIGIFTFLLIMLRPSFLYLIVALAMIFISMFIFKKENRKQALLGVGVLAIIGVLILGYCYLNKKQNSIFAISNVTHINQLDTIIQMDIYKTGDEQDQGIIDIVEQWLDGKDSVWYRQTTNKIMEEYTPDEVDAYIDRCIKNNFSTYFSKKIDKILNIQLEPCDEIYLMSKNDQTIKPMISFIFIYIYALLQVIYIIAKIVEDKKIPYEQFIMALLVLGQFATIIIGAQAEYSRLFIPVLPVVIISIAKHIEAGIEILKEEN